MRWTKLHLWPEQWTRGSAFRKMAVEYFGSLIYVFMGTSATFMIRYYQYLGTESMVTDPFLYLIINSLAWAFAGICAMGLAQTISGGHVNPMLSYNTFWYGGIGFFELLYYVFFQIAGGITGSALLFGMIPSAILGSSIPIQDLLDCTQVNPDFGQNIALGMEIFASFILSMAHARIVHFHDPKNSSDTIFRSGPLFLGFTIGGLQLVAYPISGASMNPIRSFGPTVVAGFFGTNWLYWVAPIVGGSGCVIVMALLEWNPRTGDMITHARKFGHYYDDFIDKLKIKPSEGYIVLDVQSAEDKVVVEDKNTNITTTNSTKTTEMAAAGGVNFSSPSNKGGNTSKLSSLLQKNV